MQDFSKAEVSRNHNTSFKASIKTALEFIDELNQTYQTSRDELEVLRKERAAIIENIIQTLKNKKVKIDKPLGKCNNFEINEELLKVIENLDFKEREKFQCDLIRINNRYARITELGKKLEEVSNKLSTLHVPEGDYDDEVIIDLTPKTTPVSEPIKSEEVVEQLKEETVVQENPTIVVEEAVPVVEEVVSNDDEDIPVVDDITMSIPIINNITPSTNDEVKDSTSETEQKKPVIIEESDLYLDEYTDKDDSLAVDYGFSNEEIEPKKVTSYNEPDEDEEDFLYYTITNGVTLEEIAQSVYEDPKLWIDIYKYDTNKGIIDRTAAKLKLTVKETCTKPGNLDDIKLKFPVELVTYEEITN